MPLAPADCSVRPPVPAPAVAPRPAPPAPPVVKPAAAAAPAPAVKVPARPMPAAPPEPPQEIKRELIKLPESVTVGELAAAMRRKSVEVIKALLELG